MQVEKNITILKIQSFSNAVLLKISLKNLIFCKFFKNVYSIFNIAKYFLSAEFYYTFNFSHFVVFIFYKNILLYKKYVIYILNSILNILNLNMYILFKIFLVVLNFSQLYQI